MLNNKLLLSFITLLFLVTSCKKENEVKPDAVLIARAGADKSVSLGDTVTLDGGASSESQNKPFDYSWVLTKKPTGSSATLTSAKTVKATFIPDEEGEYEAELTISNTDGVSKDKVLITATPAEPETIDANISAKTVLINRISNPNFPDYVVTKDIAVNAELTINPGVVIAFARDTRFIVNDNGGVLIAKGEADKKIRFEGREKTKGFWTGLQVNSASGANQMEYVEITNAGAKNFTGTIKGGMVLMGNYKAQMSIKNCSFIANHGHGLYIENGVKLLGFSNNTFKENTESGVLLDANNVKLLDANSAYTGGNGRNVIEIASSILDGNMNSEIQWVLPKDKTPYRISQSIKIHSGLKILPGTILEFERDVVMQIENGFLDATGTRENKIIFRGADGTNAYWKGIIFYSNSQRNTIEYADITGGGSSAIVSATKANLAIYGTGARMLIKNCTISNSGGYGVYVSYHTIVNPDLESGNIFKDNVQGASLRQ
jgi:hypothetical protein